MAKHGNKLRDARKKATERIDEDMDSGYTSPINSISDVSIESLKSVLIKSAYAQILFALTFIGAILRLYNIGFNSLWLDEASTVTFATQSFGGIWGAMASGEFNPPLFYWLEHTMLFLGNNEFILRLVPAIAGILVIPLFYIIGKEFIDKNAGIIAAAAATFSPFLIFYSQEARAYSLMLFFVAAALIFYFRAMKSDNYKEWICFSIFAVLAFWTHFYAIVIISALIVYALATRYFDLDETKRGIKSTGIGIGAFIIGSLPIIITVIPLFALRSSGAPTFGAQGIALIYQTFQQMSGYDFAMYILGTLFIIGIIKAFVTDRNKGLFLISVTVLTFIVSFILSFKIPMEGRYLIFFELIYILGIVFVYKLLSPFISSKKLIYLFIALFIVISLPVLSGYYSGFTKDDWRGFSSSVSHMVKPGDTIVMVPGYIGQPFNYYYSNTTEKTYEVTANHVSDLETIYAQTTKGHMFMVVTGDIYSEDPSGNTVNWLMGNTTVVTRDTGITLLEAKQV